MTIESADVLKQAGAGPADDGIAEDVLEEAEEHVDTYIERNLIDASKPVPDVLRDAAILTCAVDLFSRRKAPFGVQVMPDANGTTVTTRLGADPLGGVYAMLSGYCVVIGFAFPEVEE